MSGHLGLMIYGLGVGVLGFRAWSSVYTLESVLQGSALYQASTWSWYCKQRARMYHRAKPHDFVAKCSLAVDSILIWSTV